MMVCPPNRLFEGERITFQEIDLYVFLPELHLSPFHISRNLVLGFLAQESLQLVDDFLTLFSNA